MHYDRIAIDAIRTAILRCQRLRVTYRKGGHEPAREYLVEPYGFLYGAKGYLVWRGVEDLKWRKFSFTYIERVEPTRETFERDASFVLADFAADAFGVCREEPVEVVLRVLPEGMGRLRQHSFHPSQTVEPEPDGGAIVRFKASGMIEICWHMFSWGGDIEIIAPESLAERYRQILHLALSKLDASGREHVL